MQEHFFDVGPMVGEGYEKRRPKRP